MLTKLIFILTLILFSACSKKEAEPVVLDILETKKYDAIAKIIVSDDAKAAYKIYVNFKDINRTLEVNKFTKVYLQEGKTNIQIVKKRKTASIDFEVKKEKNYKFRVLSTPSNDLMILQIPNE